MIIQITVKPGAKIKEVLKQADGSFKVLVTERAIEGRANKAVREVVAKYFKVSKSKVIFLQGMKNKFKRREII